MAGDNTKSRGRAWFLGLFMIACGVPPALATFDIGPLGVHDIHGPAWLGLAAGGCFILAGIAALAGENAQGFRSAMGMLIIADLAAIGHWIAFGVGERVCGGSILLFGGDLAGLGCRIPFGFGALMLDAVLGLCVVVALQKLAGGPPRLAGLRRIAEMLVLVVLSPLLVVLFAWLIGRSGLDVLKTRLKTGRWPRNEAFIARRKAKLEAERAAAGADRMANGEGEADA